MERAMDLLKGIMLFTERDPESEPRNGKGQKMAAAAGKNLSN
jgi:hypothetical protein